MSKTPFTITYKGWVFWDITMLIVKGVLDICDENTHPLQLHIFSGDWHIQANGPHDMLLLLLVSTSFFNPRIQGRFLHSSLCEKKRGNGWSGQHLSQSSFRTNVSINLFDFGFTYSFPFGSSHLHEHDYIFSIFSRVLMFFISKYCSATYWKMEMIENE